MVQRKFRAAYMQAKQGHKTEALPLRLLYTFPIPFSWLSNFNGCSSMPGAFVSRNDNRGFYNQGAHPCFQDLRGRKKYIKPCIYVLNEVCTGHMSACVCACESQPTSLNGVEGSVRLGLGEGRGTFRWRSHRGRFRRRSPRGRHIRKSNWRSRTGMELETKNGVFFYYRQPSSQWIQERKKCVSDIHLIHVLVRMKDAKSVRWGGRFRPFLLMHNSLALWCLRSQQFMATRTVAAPIISLLLFSCASFNVWRVTGRRCQQSMGTFLGLIMSSNAQFVLNSSEWCQCAWGGGFMALPILHPLFSLIWLIWAVRSLAAC